MAAVTLAPAASSHAAALISASPTAPVTSDISQPTNNSSQNSGSGLQQVFLWESDQALLSLTVQDHNNAFRTRSGTLLFHSFANATDASTFSNPSQIASFAGLDNSTVVAGNATSAYFTYTFTTPIALTNGGYYAWDFQFPSFSTALKASPGNPYPDGMGFVGTTGSYTPAANNKDFTFYLAAVPEPSAFALMGLGLGVVALARRRRQNG